MKKSWRLFGTMAACMALTACGGGGGGGDTTPTPTPPTPPTPPAKVVIASAQDNLLPLNANGISVFSSSAGPESVVLRVSDAQVVANGVMGVIIRRQDPMASQEFSRVYVPTNAGLRQYAKVGADALERAFDGTDVMRLPAHADDSFVQLDTTVDSGQDFDGDGRADRVTLHAEVTVVGLESVTTPAGNFSKVLRQKHVLTQTTVPSSGAAPVKVTTTTDTWYASNVGIVRSVVVHQGNALNGTTTETLVQYRVGTALGGIVTPAAQSTAPSGPASAGAPVNAVFNVDMDAASFAGNAFSVTDSNGRQVAGSVRVKGKTVSFVPAQPWATGGYTGRIGTAALDLFGNPIAAPQTWTFLIDGTAPGVLSTWPAADATNVDLGVTIGIALSEAPAAASVNVDNIKLTEGGAPVPMVLRVNGSGINIEPTGGLVAGKRYTVDVNGITDTVGNTMAQGLRFSFDTTPRRFASAERLFPVNGSAAALAVATGDINGDGIPDVVYTDWATGAGYPMALFVRTGKADSLLNDPLRVDIGPLTGDSTRGYCDLSALAVGDVTGDGRADIVVGARTCGVLVVRQTGAGTLDVGQFITTPMHTVRIADIDGDGRLDVVGVHNHLALAVVWRQTAGGQLVMDQTPSLRSYGGRDVEVGDIDGDGRQDLVVSLFNVEVGANIALLHRQPDGSFAAPTYLSTGSIWGAAGIALGDLNGDGRLDIVATTGGNAPTWFAVFHQSPNGGFSAITQVPTLDNPWAVRVADINHDGRADIVVTHSGWSNVGIYLQQGAGTLAGEELYMAQTGAVHLQVLAITDLNRDGLRDIVVSGSILRQTPLTGRGALGAQGRQGAAVHPR